MKVTEKEAIGAMRNDAAEVNVQVQGLKFIFRFLLEETSQEDAGWLSLLESCIQKLEKLGLSIEEQAAMLEKGATVEPAPAGGES